MSDKNNKPVEISRSGVTFNLDIQFNPYALTQLLIVLICGAWGGYLVWQSSLDIGNPRPPWLSLILILIAGVVLSVDVEKLIAWVRMRISGE